MKKVIFLIVILVLTLMKLNNYSGFLCDEINIFSISKGFASNLYDNYQTVSSDSIEVIDYEIIDSKLYITPMNNIVMLPIDGIIVTYNNEFVEIENSLGVYRIENIKNIKYRLYQYYENNTILGYSDKYVITANEYTSIVSELDIRYETI